MLNEAQETVGYSRKHLIRKFSSSRRIHTNSQPGRPKKLSGDVILIVKEIWLQSEQPCGMRLKSILKEKVASFLSSMYFRTGSEDSQLQRGHSRSDTGYFQSSVLSTMKTLYCSTFYPSTNPHPAGTFGSLRVWLAQSRHRDSLWKLITREFSLDIDLNGYPQRLE